MANVWQRLHIIRPIQGLRNGSHIKAKSKTKIKIKIKNEKINKILQ